MFKTVTVAAMAAHESRSIDDDRLVLIFKLVVNFNSASLRETYKIPFTSFSFPPS